MIQADLVWEAPAQNLSKLEALLDDVPETDVIVLPEMFTTGFTMRPEAFAEAPDGPSVSWLRRQAEARQAAVTGSLVIREAGKYYNRLFWASPDGRLFHYDKRHLFSFGGEDKHYTAGNRRLEVTHRGWKIRPLICYDLRFPEWSRNDTDYDLLMYVANWPARRIAHWRALLIARAIENQACVLGVNRVGTDGKGMYHDGHSMAVTPLGEIIREVTDREAVETVVLSKADMMAYRERFPALRDMRRESDS